MPKRAVAEVNKPELDGQWDRLSEFVSARIMARAFAEAAASGERLEIARGFGVRLVEAWWAALTRDDPKPQALREFLEPFECAPLPAGVAALADSLGEAAARFEADAAAHQIGLAYTSMLPLEHRSSLGIYYTPPTLTERLIDLATEAGVDWAHDRILDPACGGGAFLAPVAKRILDALPGCSPRILLENLATRLRGYEIDPYGAWLSQVALDAILLPLCRETGNRLSVVVSIRDTLDEEAPQDRFDLVIGNPPYGRVRLSPERRERFKRSLYGHANLYGLFTDQAVRFAKQEGVIAYVTPTSFLSGEYFKNLRATLGRHAPPLTINFVSLRKGVFEDVLQETLLATYKVGGGASLTEVHEVRPDGRGGLAIEPIGNCRLPDNPSDPWLLPRNSGQAGLVSVLAEMSHGLADWGYTVSTGPLVWNRHKDQLAEHPGKNRYPLIWAEAITADGTFAWRAKKKNHTPYFEERRGDDWLVTKKSCVLLQRTTAKEQNRRLIAAVLPEDFLRQHGSVTIENHLNMILPVIDSPAVPPEVLAAFLNSTAADRVFRCVSGSVAVSAYELEAMPLPSSENLHELTELVRASAPRKEIELACERLYRGRA